MTEDQMVLVLHTLALIALAVFSSVQSAQLSYLRERVQKLETRAGAAK
jgi:hypothetical protein